MSCVNLCVAFVCRNRVQIKFNETPDERSAQMPIKTILHQELISILKMIRFPIGNHFLFFRNRSVIIFSISRQKYWDSLQKIIFFKNDQIEILVCYRFAHILTKQLLLTASIGIKN